MVRGNCHSKDYFSVAGVRNPDADTPPRLSGDHLGQIVLSCLSAGLIDCSKDIFQPGLLRIKTDGEQVLVGVISHCHDTLKGSDGGAHGVRAAASHKPAALDHARHPKIDAVALHGKSFF